MAEQVIDLYGYHKWANQRIFEHLHQLSDEVYNKTIQSVFPSVAEVLIHVYQVDKIWSAVMMGKTFDEVMAIAGRARMDAKDKALEEIEVLYRDASEELHTFLISQDDLDKIIICEHPEFGRLETPLSQLVQHVVNHGTYHRGNITAMLRQMGHKGVPTDYIFYLYELSSVN